MARHTMDRRLVTVCGVLVILFLAACGGSPSAGDQGGATITKVTLKRDNGSGEPGDAVDKFLPSDRIQFFEAELSSMLGPGTKVHWVFTAVDTTAGKDIKVAEADVDVLAGNKLSANVSLENDWPTGKYRADIFINGKLIKSVDYTVEGAG